MTCLDGGEATDEEADKNVCFTVNLEAGQT